MIVTGYKQGAEAPIRYSHGSFANRWCCVVVGMWMGKLFQTLGCAIVVERTVSIHGECVFTVDK